ncbi:LacI family DNA-binding transcriptional regulator [Leifsonia shinshuensis]|uniref:LacI family DNA-binding transcriptional regulator n=1 Tax=Leifsonia shinshuensis TaxID=150026 RepID=UPI0027E30E61|nr:LacI family DNA-binding transcriptional regulator [Leifsonia shinshuensis]
MTRSAPTRPTLHQVAEVAGVSLASASRALTGNSASLEMVRKVKRAAKSLGYLPDATARSLRLGGTRQVVFAVDDIGNPNYVQMLRSIEHEFGSDGPRLSVVATGRDPEHTTELVRSLNMGVGDGLIISPIRVTPNLRRAIVESVVPVVVIGSLHRKVDVDSVRIDSSTAVGYAVEHLVAIGRSRIAFINGPLDTNPGAARRRGFDEAMARLGAQVHPEWQVAADDFTVSAGRAAAVELFDHLAAAGMQIDAVVAGNDLIGVGTISAAIGRGLRVPEDVAITGIDDTEIASVYNPPLTSVSLQSAERGRLAARLLMDRFENPACEPRSIEVVPELIVRESTHPAGKKETRS